MNTDHVSFDDIEKCVYMKDITPDNLRLLQRVQSHVLKCGECRNVYDKLMSVKNVQEDILDGSLTADTEVSSKAADLISNVAARLVVSIQKGIKLTLDRIDNLIDSVDYSFDHPMALASRSSGSDEDEMALVDEENDYNRLELSSDGLKVTLDAEDWEDSIPVIVVKQMDGTQHTVEMTSRGDRYIAVLPIDISGQYEICIGHR